MFGTDRLLHNYSLPSNLGEELDSKTAPNESNQYKSISKRRLVLIVTTLFICSALVFARGILLSWWIANWN